MLDSAIAMVIQFDRFDSGHLLSQSRWDIFCSVVDNYGDVGVAWRLARQLASEHGLAVRLWIDDLRALSRITSGIAPGIDPAQDENVIQGIQLHRWTGGRDAAVPDDVADVVVEAFGCGLPKRYEDAMVRRAQPPAWIVLEYLSAATQQRAAYYPDKAAQFREIAEAEPIGRLRDRLLHLARQYDDVAEIVEARRQR